jgi:hypothetical protein
MYLKPVGSRLIQGWKKSDSLQNMETVQVRTRQTARSSSALARHSLSVCRDAAKQIESTRVSPDTDSDGDPGILATFRVAGPPGLAIRNRNPLPFYRADS